MWASIYHSHNAIKPQAGFWLQWQSNQRFLFILWAMTYSGFAADLLGSEALGVSFAGEEDILKGLFRLKTVKNAEQIQLDTTYLPGCGEPCLEQLLLVSTSLAFSSAQRNSILSRIVFMQH